MRALKLAAVAAVTLAFAAPLPALAQDDPFVGGELVAVTAVSIDDGHYLDYASFLGGYFKAQEEFAIKQGWQTSFEILANVHPRKGEPDLYLLRRFKNMVDGAESERRSQIIRDNVKMTDAQMEAASGDRAKFRHVDSTMLLRELKYKK
jgi:hypothetical protein